LCRKGSQRVMAGGTPVQQAVSWLRARVSAAMTTCRIVGEEMGGVAGII
jgi:hypothetical protein